MAKKYTFLHAGAVVFAGAGDDLALELAKIQDLASDMALDLTACKVKGWPALQQALIESEAAPMIESEAAPVIESEAAPVIESEAAPVIESEAVADNFPLDIVNTNFTMQVLGHEFRFSEGFTALAHAKGKAIDRVLRDLTEGAALGLTMATVKGQARSKIIATMEQADLLRLAKQVQSGCYDNPIRTICKSHNVSFTVFAEDGKGVARSEWKKLGFLLAEDGKAVTPKGNPTPYAKVCQKALAHYQMVQDLADALRDALTPATKKELATI